MPATLSIMGLYNADPGVIDPLVSAMPTQDLRQALPAELLSECAELEVIYPNPSTFKTILAAWVKHRKPIWDKLYETTQYDYDPIYNYDRYEEHTETRETTRNNEGEYTTITTGNSDYTPSQIKTVVKDKRYGFNSAVNPAPASEAETEVIPDLTLRTTPLSLAGTAKGTARTADTSHDNTEETQSGTENESITHSTRAYGNIGVVSTQQMIGQQREIVKYDLIEDVVNDFKARFCLLVY